MQATTELKSEGKTMESLPSELISRILLHVSPLERVDCALTCRRWAEVVRDSALLDDVWLIIRHVDLPLVSPILAKSQRQYRNLRFQNVNFRNCAPVNLANVFGSLRRLEFIGCVRASRQFNNIIRHCLKLESLKIDSYLGIDDTIDLTDNECMEEIRESLSHVTHLHLTRLVGHDWFVHLMSLMPNVTSFFATAEEHTASLEDLSTILVKNPSLSQLYLYPSPPLQENLLRFIEQHSERIYGLRLWVTRVSTIESCVAMGNCKNLRRLSVSCCTRLQEHHMEKMCQNAPDLESLNLRYCYELTDRGLLHLLGLKKLQELSIRKCPRLTCEALSQLGRISTLRHLRLRSVPVDVRLLRGIASLRDLKTLIINDGELDSECFDIICDNFKTIEHLEIGVCAECTDDDVMKLNRLRNLRKLKLDGLPRIRGRALLNGVGPPHLSHLALSQCTVTDSELASIAAHHKRLRSFHLIYCWHITEPALLDFLEKETLLDELVVAHCQSLGNAWVRKMESDSPSRCPRLRILDIYDEELTMFYKIKFRKYRPSVNLGIYPLYTEPEY